MLSWEKETYIAWSCYLKESIVRACRGLLFIKKPIVLCALEESQLISIISREKTKSDDCAFFPPFALSLSSFDLNTLGHILEYCSYQNWLHESVTGEF